MTDERPALLEIDNLSVFIHTHRGPVRAVENTTFTIERGETFALIGESGSGKSILGLAVMRLLSPAAEVSGAIKLNSVDLGEIPEKEMQEIRGKSIGAIAQNPYLSMNPVMRVGDQIAEPMKTHLGMNREEAKERTRSVLKFFDITPPEIRYREYPYQYSGGMLQRAMVAMGTAAEPELIIADEPTKGVDAIKKRNIAATFRKVTGDGCAFLLITHDIGFARAMSTRIGVNYCGQILEIARTGDFFEEPLHPYSKALLESLPENGMKPIPGDPPSMIDVPEGCRFHPRCPYATDRCKTPPPFVKREAGEGHGERYVRCWLHA
ncbi:peptide/nickel transport system ATP-binding protein [Methanomicrobium sp. W14]|uniref:ABC transporter ATP-binding protein n=1 Tax=Methanomicrobium sp. W14 TaxID=2817839 RepID=UPI001AE94058|nr:ABC transporter ATP-binding protein [Methanomicrobium sp. W14]MBP2132197.1 peptide/nickel transport system ATP-binding protein [Methanomicrobium sp. W14]